MASATFEDTEVNMGELIKNNMLYWKNSVLLESIYLILTI